MPKKKKKRTKTACLDKYQQYRKLKNVLRCNSTSIFNPIPATKYVPSKPPDTAEARSLEKSLEKLNQFENQLIQENNLVLKSILPLYNMVEDTCKTPQMYYQFYP